MSQAQNGFKDFQTELAGKLVLVTGAGRGIGLSIARAFAGQSCRIAIVSKNEESIKKASAEIKSLGVSVFSRALDVSDESSCLRFIEDLFQNLGPVDVLVNNAGIHKTAALDLHPSQTWHEILDTNLNSAFYFSRSLVPSMKEKRWGRIINISSVSGKQGELHAPAYSASKFALIGFTQSIALELASWGITANAICPGWVDTDMSRTQLGDPEYSKLNQEQDLFLSHKSSKEPEPCQTKLSSMDIARLSVPQERFIEKEEIAELAVYLSSNRARGITGQAINICGGLCLS